MLALYWKGIENVVGTENNNKKNLVSLFNETCVFKSNIIYSSQINKRNI